MLVQSINEHCASGLYATNYHILYDLVGDVRRFRTLSVFDSSSYEYFQVDIKQVYGRTAERRRTRIMETVRVMEKSYEKAISYWKKEEDEKFGRKDESQARLERNGPYVVHDGIPITMNEMAWAADVSRRRSSTAIFPSRSVDIFKLSTIEVLLVFVGDLDVEGGRSDPDTEVRLAFVKSGYLMWGYIPTIQHVDLEKGITKKLVEYEGRFQRILAMDRFRSSRDKLHTFVLLSGGGEEGGGLWAAKVLLLYRMSVRVTNKIEDYAFLPYMEVTCAIDTVDEKPRCACLRWGTDDEVDHSLRQGTAISEQGGLRVQEWLGIERLETLPGCVTVVRAKTQLHHSRK